MWVQCSQVWVWVQEKKPKGHPCHALGERYLCSMEVGAVSYYSLGNGKLLYLHYMEVGMNVIK
jgi:hypothetical protein